MGIATHTGHTPGREAGFPADLVEGALNLRVGGGAEAAGSARRALENLSGDIDPPTMETLQLLVTELIANSIQHARAGAVGMKVAVGPRSVLVEVSDGGPGFEPAARVDGQDDTSGWGLFLVERLSRRWGVSHEGRATKVWFELGRT